MCVIHTVFLIQFRRYKLYNNRYLNTDRSKKIPTYSFFQTNHGQNNPIFDLAKRKTSKKLYFLSLICSKTVNVYFVLLQIVLLKNVNVSIFHPKNKRSSETSIQKLDRMPTMILLYFTSIIFLYAVIL